MTSWILALAVMLASPCAAAAEPADPVVEDSQQRKRFSLTCVRMVGAMGGVQDVRASWAFDGTDRPWRVDGSPMVAMACGQAEGRFGYWFGADTAPLVQYRSAGDQRRAHLAGLELALSVRAGTFEVGPVLVASAAGIGGGVRAQWLPWLGQNGARRGFVLRGTTVLTGFANAQVAVLYTLTSDRLAF